MTHRLLPAVILSLLVLAGASVSQAQPSGTFPPDTLLLGPDTQELRFFADVGNIGPACVGAVSWNEQLRAISLPDAGDGVEFYLATVPAGRYLIAVQCRTGHQASGWEYCSPYVRYVVEVDGKRVEMIRSKAKPQMRLKATGWYDFSGWIISRDYVQMRPGQRLRISCQEAYTYVLQVALLTPRQAMQCGWLVPDVMGKALENVAHAREKLADFAARVEQLEGPDLSRVLAAFEAGATEYQARLDRWRQAFRRAQESTDDKRLGELQDAAQKLRQEAHRPLAWVAAEAADWCRRVAGYVDDLPPVPATGDYHARWAKILRRWIETYAENLRAAPARMSGLQVARRLGRALRLLDLRARYLREVAAAEPATVATAEAGGVANSSRHPPAERPGQICLNGVWDFAPGADPARPPTQWERIRVPHGPWKITYGSFFNHGEEWNPDWHVAWYRTRFVVPPNWRGEGVAVRFEAVFHYAEVYLNGRYCGSHLGGFERFRVNVAGAVRPGQVNEMLVMVKDTYDTKTDLSRNRRGDYSANYLMVNDLWGQNYGGIWQDVYLEYHPTGVCIEDVGISTPVRGGKRLNVAVTVNNASGQARKLRLRYTVLDEGEVAAVVVTPPRKVAAGRTACWQTSRRMPAAKLWGIGGQYGRPHLYRLHTELLEGNQVLDERYDAFGFCQMWIEGDHFVLNGKRLFLAGGGVWYLQEEKFPFANRFFAAHLYRMDRKANINIERFHRHGDVSEQFYAEASEMGMLMEPEAPNWGAGSLPLDAMGQPDLQDPVVRPNMRSYFRQWAAKHRNWPCIGLLSIENENFAYQDNDELMDLVQEMSRAVRESDPLRIPDCHGNHMMADDPRLDFVNVHYCLAKALNAFKEAAAGRPVVNGEHNMGGHTLANNHDRRVAAEAEERLANFWREEISGYLDYGAAGLFVFVPAFQAYVTTSDWHKTGPWGDLFKDLSSFNPGDDRWPCNFGAYVDVPWPSLSGPDAKAEKMIVASSRGTFNWFDPLRAVCTPNKVHRALRESFPRMPRCNTRRCQEALVTVTLAGKPVAGATVILEPAANQPTLPLGAVTDSAGTAWIVPRLAGPYTVRVYGPDGRQGRGGIVLGRYRLIGAGYEDGLVRQSIALDYSSSG